METLTNTDDTIYLRRRSKIALPLSDAPDGERLPISTIAAALKNLEALGYTFTPVLIDACQLLSHSQFVELYRNLVPVLKAQRGAAHVFRPMYPNFPDQVMEMELGELYVNAIIHYWSGGALTPATDIQERFPLLDTVALTPIDSGSADDFWALFPRIAGGNASLSEQDRDDLTWFIRTAGDAIGPYLPDTIPQKENVAFIAGLLLVHTSREAAHEFVGRFVRTATDVLRLAVGLCGGDLSLASATRFRTFSRPERVLMLNLLERATGALEDMNRWRPRWIRLGEKLHPGEYAARFPRTAAAFSTLRSGSPIATFNGAVEGALASGAVSDALRRLTDRPGELARRLDHLLRLDPDQADTVLGAFAGVAPAIATPLLLQLMHHFTVRNTRPGLRVFFPKGQVGKAQSMKNTLPALPENVCERVSTLCATALGERFASLPALGRVFVDPELANYAVPFAMRSSSKSLRTLVRGSRLPLPPGDIVRFFVWWRNGDSRADIDLSATLFGETFGYVDVLAYYNLKNFGGVHSGDIVDAPDGASEFIDVDLEKVRAAGVRYVVMTLNSYTGQPFVSLPECFAGWMIRQCAGSGEIYEPSTVQDRLDLTADTKIALPLVIDVEARRIVWCDLGVRRHPQWQNNVEENLTGTQASLRALVESRRPSLYDLFVLHAVARGTMVDTPEDADTILSVASGAPFRLDEIVSQYLV